MINKKTFLLISLILVFIISSFNVIGVDCNTVAITSSETFGVDGESYDVTFQYNGLNINGNVQSGSQQYIVETNVNTDSINLGSTETVQSLWVTPENNNLYLINEGGTYVFKEDIGGGVLSSSSDAAMMATEIRNQRVATADALVNNGAVWVNNDGVYELTMPSGQIVDTSSISQTQKTAAINVLADSDSNQVDQNIYVSNLANAQANLDAAKIDLIAAKATNNDDEIDTALANVISAESALQNLQAEAASRAMAESDSNQQIISNSPSSLPGNPTTPIGAVETQWVTFDNKPLYRVGNKIVDANGKEVPENNRKIKEGSELDPNYKGQMGKSDLQIYTESKFGEFGKWADGYLGRESLNPDWWKGQEVAGGIGAATDFISSAKTMGALTDALSWTDPNKAFLPGLVDIADAFNPDEWANSKCDYPFDPQTESNVLITPFGEMAIILEGSKADHSQVIMCLTQDEDDNQTMCNNYFGSDSGIVCVEGVCANTDSGFPQPEPYLYTLYSIEVMYEAGEEMGDGKTSFTIELSPGNKVFDLDKNGITDHNDTIRVEEEGSFRRSGSNPMIIFTNQTEVYTDVCMKFGDKPENLDDILDEYDLGSDKFCTSFVVEKTVNE